VFADADLVLAIITPCGVHKSGFMPPAVFVDQSAQAISTGDVAWSGQAGEP